MICFLMLFCAYNSISQIFDYLPIDTTDTKRSIKISYSSWEESKYMAYTDRYFEYEYLMSGADFEIISDLKKKDKMSKEELRLFYRIFSKYEPIVTELIPDIYDGKSLNPNTFFIVEINDMTYEFYSPVAEYNLFIDDLETGILIKDKIISASENFRGLDIRFNFYAGDKMINEYNSKRRLSKTMILNNVQQSEADTLRITLTNKFEDKLIMNFSLKV